MITGNKGEWSEIYTFLKLISDGKLFAADENLNIIPDLFYPIIKILRQEVNRQREYVLNGQVKIIDGNNQELICSIPKIKFLHYSKKLLENINKSIGSTFSCSEVENFLNSIDCFNLKASSKDKSDIKMVVHDLQTGQNPTLGFSIKSMLGKQSTLFNPGKTTNFIYEIVGEKNSVIDINIINSIEDQPKILNKLKYLKENNFKIKFYDIESEIFKLNLELIDSNLPEILSYLLLYRYSELKKSKVNSLLELIKEINPLNYKNTLSHPFYEYKIKRFLTDVALGMTPSKVWSGEYIATGGFIIVRQDGEIVCYHIYNQKKFQDYLINNTKFEQASTDRYDFGKLYREKNKIFIKLNLQIRFIK